MSSALIDHKMIHKLTILSALIISASCMVLPQTIHPIPWIFALPQNDPNYNFAYEVNDFATGDIKSQSESRIAGTVYGQYTLVQPDGVIRNVEYKADDHDGFQATVNNIGTPVQLAVKSNNNIHNAPGLQTSEEPKIQENVTADSSEAKIPSTTAASVRNNQWS